MKRKIQFAAGLMFAVWTLDIFADYRCKHCVPGVKRAKVNYLSAQRDRKIIMAFSRKMKVHLTRSPLTPGVPHSPLSPWKHTKHNNSHLQQGIPGRTSPEPLILVNILSLRDNNVFEFVNVCTHSKVMLNNGFKKKRVRSCLDLLGPISWEWSNNGLAL